MNELENLTSRANQIGVFGKKMQFKYCIDDTAEKLERYILEFEFPSMDFWAYSVGGDLERLKKLLMAVLEMFPIVCNLKHYR